MNRAFGRFSEKDDSCEVQAQSRDLRQGWCDGRGNSKAGVAERDPWLQSIARGWDEGSASHDLFSRVRLVAAPDHRQDANEVKGHSLHKSDDRASYGRRGEGNDEPVQTVSRHADARVEEELQQEAKETKP